MDDDLRARLARAAAAIRDADALVVTAGAGMGVDSGLPDFRGDEGFWTAYPPFRALGLSFQDLADPAWFRTDPDLAWGFYGHRLGLYRATRPHAGFALLHAWLATRPRGGFVVTSNVDGQFQRAGFDPDRVVEHHGALDWLQCTRGCDAGIFAADPYEVAVDPATFRARPPLPACPSCGALARPNVLMFGDSDWDATRTAAQHRRLAAWLADLASAPARVTVVECGAGRAIPTIRRLSERLADPGRGATLVRINPRDPDVPAGQISLPVGALAALTAIAEYEKGK
jgi:NAD-dependent SIR2 family protein deacetylase